MKIKRIQVYTIPLLLALSLTACIDDAYDLSDIDSTVGVKVNDLVVPLKLDAITLQNLFDIEENSQIKEINGEYAILEEGSFESNSINIPSFKIPAPEIDPISETLDLVLYGMGDSQLTFTNKSPHISIPDDFCLFDAEIPETSSSFNISAQNIDSALVKIDEIGANFIIELFISFSGLDSILNSVELENLVIELPKGLKATASNDGNYNPSTGLLTYSKLIISDSNFQKKLTLSVSSIDANEAGMKLSNGELLLETSYSISGRLAIYGRNLKKPVDTDKLLNLKQTTYLLNVKFPDDDIEVVDFTGDIRYRYKGIDASPIIIDDLPNLLVQEGTDIRIVNPQIYLSINNPLYNDYQLYATGGIELIPTPKSDITFETNLMFDRAINQFCLSPTSPEEMYLEGFTFVEFSNLGDILSGDQLPSKIDIEVVNPEVPQQTVHNFVLGQSFETVKGSYTFYTPLALTNEAQIHYIDTINGWSDEELDRLKVDRLDINAKVESNVPVGFKVIAYPIDKSGNEITKNGQPIEAILQSIGADGETNDMLPAIANTNVVIEIDGPLIEIDGIILKAILSGAEGNKALKPNQKIKFTDIQLKVTGEYINEF